MKTPSEPVPVAYLPGASGNIAVWRPIAQWLRSRRPPIFVEYPGLGDSAPDPSIGSLPELADAIAATLPSQFDVVALSLGGVVALHLALRHAERVRKLVLVTTAGGVDVLRLGATDWRISSQRRPGAPTWFLDDTTDLTARLSAITIPALLVFGDADPVAPVSVGRHLFEHLPNATLEIIEGATHDLEDECPEVLASLIEEFLRK